MSDIGFFETYGPWAIIAGGSEGVGSAFADRLAKQGFKLLLIARKPDPLEATARDIRSKYATEVRTLSLDLTASDAAARILTAADGLRNRPAHLQRGSRQQLPVLSRASAR